jgi:hypothetical protein
MYNYKTRGDDQIFFYPPDSDMEQYLPDARAYQIFLYQRQEGASFDHAYTEAHKDHEARTELLRKSDATLDQATAIGQHVQQFTTDALQLIWSSWRPETSAADLASIYYDAQRFPGVTKLDYYTAIGWELSWRKLFI